VLKGPSGKMEEFRQPEEICMFFGPAIGRPLFPF
jgi:hypothetical protein